MGEQPRKVYEGRVEGDDWAVHVLDNVTMTVRRLRHYRLHSPTGFAWGYAGSGPSDLARCLLIDHLGLNDEQALTGVAFDLNEAVPSWLYQRFKEAFVARWPMDGDWTLTSDVIDGFLVGVGWTDRVE